MNISGDDIVNYLVENYPWLVENMWKSKGEMKQCYMTDTRKVCPHNALAR